MLISSCIFLFVDSTGVILHDSLCKIFLHHTDPRCSVSVHPVSGKKAFLAPLLLSWDFSNWLHFVLFAHIIIFIILLNADPIV